MPIITLPDGKNIEFPKEVTGLDIAEKISILIFSAISKPVTSFGNSIFFPSGSVIIGI